MSELINNREHRLRLLKEIIRHLHEGQAPELVKNQLRELVKEVDATEIAAMEEELIAEGVAPEEVQSMCDLHSEVLRDILVETPPPEIPPGHPIDTFQRENEAITGVVSAMRTVAESLLDANVDTQVAEVLQALRHQLSQLLEIEKHYRRKENLLFSCLERHGITGPSKVMWGKDDEVREYLKAFRDCLAIPEEDPASWQVTTQLVFIPALDAVEEMIYKEEKILLPMSQEALTEDEWAEIWEQSDEYGWCLIEPRVGYQPARATQPDQVVQLPEGHAVTLPTGTLMMEQLLGIFGALPVDITFVDSEDRVRFFSEGPNRIFERSPAILGRQVQHCHPPKSVHIVEQILSDFRSGRQNIAEFWIQMQGRFIHIRYFAIRDEASQYLGTLEITQDITELRNLEGERRLLQYQSAADLFRVVEKRTE